MSGAGRLSIALFVNFMIGCSISYCEHTPRLRMAAATTHTTVRDISFSSYASVGPLCSPTTAKGGAKSWYAGATFAFWCVLQHYLCAIRGVRCYTIFLQPAFSFVGP